jgi:hypothetical protein
VDIGASELAFIAKMKVVGIQEQKRKKIIKIKKPDGMLQLLKTTRNCTRIE